MSTNKLKLILVLFVVILGGSCNKDILDIKPTNFVSDVAVFEDLTLTTQFVNNIYGSLLSGFDRRDAGLGQDWSMGQGMLAMATDEAEGPTATTLNNLNNGELNSNFNYGTEMWFFNYLVIRKCNTFLSKIDGVPGNATLKNRLKGEVLFIRAFCYADLIKAFGGVPLITKEQSVSDDLLVARNTYLECLQQIKTDCDEAASLLPSTYPSSDLGRATKGAALALKGRMLLYYASPINNASNELPRWQEAAAASKAVMDLGVYSLYNDYYRLFLDKAGNNEVIFASKYQRPNRTQQTPWKLAMSIQAPDVVGGAWGGFSPTQNLVDAYEMKNGKMVGEAGSGYNPQDPYKDRDNRLDQSILRNGSPWKGVVVETFDDGNAQKAANGDRTKTGYGLKKLLDEKYVTADQVYQGGDNDWIYIRYAEVLLNYAEAQNEAAGPDANVYKAINDVRQRSGQPALAGLSQSEMRDRIRNERRVELAFEEHRFWDVRRWKLGSIYFNQPVNRVRVTKSGSAFNYSIQELEKRSYKETYNLLPIPQTEIDRNPNLGQNPGY
ncbi:MAG: RagB/SusD family nutrient uptake outer membrane protein [Bacteroidota bacterium]